MRKAYKRITYKERKKIEHMVEKGVPVMKMATEIGVHIATMYRELQRGTDEEGNYKADVAQNKIV